MATIISADEIKKSLPNYSPELAEKFHRESARRADKEFQISLKKNQYKEIILLSGGAASGKTEFMMTQLVAKRCIIFDATLDTEERARIKIKQIVEAKKRPVIYSVIPDDLSRAFIAFLSRDRKFSDEHFYRTHSGSRGTLLWIATNYLEVEIHLIESSYTSDQRLQFATIEFDSKDKLIKYLYSIQMSEDDIISLLTS